MRLVEDLAQLGDTALSNLIVANAQGGLIEIGHHNRRVEAIELRSERPYLRNSAFMPSLPTLSSLSRARSASGFFSGGIPDARTCASRILRLLITN